MKQIYSPKMYQVQTFGNTLKCSSGKTNMIKFEQGCVLECTRDVNRERDILVIIRYFRM